MDLREAAEKELAESLNKAFEETTKLRDELRDVQGVHDFSSLDDANLVAYKDSFRKLLEGLPIYFVMTAILKAQLTKTETE